ncbi:MAG: ribonuclease HI [Gemmataceae bacterium]
MDGRKRVIIFTDGACLGNPGPGGWAAVLLCDGHRRELVGSVRRTTNNRMELRAAIEALRVLKFPCEVELHSDSRYVVDTASNLMRGWRANGDLWRELAELVQRHRVRFVWVPGHAGVPENERCDLLSSSAALAGTDEIDLGYESPPQEPTLFDSV